MSKVSHCNKNPTELAAVLVVVQQVLREVDPAPANAGARLLKRVVNAMDRRVEIAAQIAAMALLGNSSSRMSHRFVVVHPWEFVRALPGLFPEHVMPSIECPAATADCHEAEAGDILDDAGDMLGFPGVTEMPAVSNADLHAPVSEDIWEAGDVAEWETFILCFVFLCATDLKEQEISG